jgi:hypothetical protein
VNFDNTLDLIISILPWVGFIRNSYKYKNTNQWIHRPRVTPKSARQFKFVQKCWTIFSRGPTTNGMRKHQRKVTQKTSDLSLCFSLAKSLVFVMICDLQWGQVMSTGSKEWILTEILEIRL